MFVLGVGTQTTQTRNHISILHLALHLLHQNYSITSSQFDFSHP